MALDDVSVSFGVGERVALVGENGAGKSSLMNVLFGLYQPDTGEIRAEGRAVKLRSPREAMALGIGMVHQHFMLVPTLTVAENVVLGREPRKHGRLDLQKACAEVEATCQRFGFRLDPQALVGDLSVGSQQKVEIVRALHGGARLLILDEPTAVLTPQEADELFAVTRELSARGHTVVFIGHKLREVLSVAERVVVMRRGRCVAERPAAATHPEELAALMLGTGVDEEAVSVLLEQPRLPSSAPSARVAEAASASSGRRGRVAESPPPAFAEATPAPAPLGRTASGGVGSPSAAPGSGVNEPLLRVRGLATHAGPGQVALRDIELEVRAGEILGIAGVDGNGQRELAEALTGLRAWQAGTLSLAGEELRQPTVAALRARGLAHIPENRLRTGIVAAMTVAENLALGAPPGPPYSSGEWLTLAPRRAHAAALLRTYDVRPPDPDLPVGRLSGGNQQKVVVARELSRAPRLIVAVQPTRGLDLHALARVHAQLRAEREKGAAVLLLTLDLEELLALSDRLHVISGGRLSPAWRREDVDREQVGRAMLSTGARDVG